MRSLLLYLILLAGEVQAACSWSGNTGTVASPYSQDDMNACISDASGKTGDVTIQVPDCSVTYSAAAFPDMSSGYATVTSLTIRGQNDCTLDGNGRPTACGTNIAAGSFGYTGREGIAFRLAHMTLSGTSVGVAGNGIYIAGTGKSWRIDHILFDNFSASNRCILVTDSGTGVTYGVLDHLNVQEYGKNFVHYQSDANFGGGNYSWMRALDLGGPDAIYIEDSTFYKTTYNPSVAVTDSNGAGRFVIRHCNLTNSWIQAHDAIIGGFRGVRKWEIYDNTINLTDLGNNFIAMQPRGGTGVVFNNTITGNGSILLDLYRYDTTGTDPWVNVVGLSSGSANFATTSGPLISGVGTGFTAIDGLGVSPAGYPARDQAGTDGNTPQTSQPFLFWNNTRNGSAITSIGEGRAPSYIVSGRDYCIDGTSMPATCNGITTTYTTYTYPHPLAGGSAPTVSAFAIRHKNGGRRR